MKYATTCVLAVLAMTIATGCEKETTVKGQGERSLTLIKPEPVTVERGGTAKVTVEIERKNVTEPVEFEVDNLPAGVKAVIDEGPISGNELTFVLEAGDEADLVSGQEATITVEGPKDLTAKDTFEITVKEKGE